MKDINQVVSKFSTSIEAMPMIKALFGREEGKNFSNWDNFGTTQGYNPHEVKKFVQEVWDQWKKENSWDTDGDQIWQVRKLDKFWDTRITSTVMKNNMVATRKNSKTDLNCVYFFQSLIRICDVKIKQLQTKTGKFVNTGSACRMDRMQAEIDELKKAVQELQQASKKTTLDQLKQRHLNM